MSPLITPINISDCFQTTSCQTYHSAAGETDKALDEKREGVEMFVVINMDTAK
jgi:hypothetical protein